MRVKAVGGASTRRPAGGNELTAPARFPKIAPFELVVSLGFVKIWMCETKGEPGAGRVFEVRP